MLTLYSRRRKSTGAASLDASPGATGTTSDTPVEFIVKLIDVISNSSNIIWHENGHLEILNSSKVCLEDLGKRFKSTKWESFIRQLNLYGFQKIQSVKKIINNELVEQAVFFHSSFIPSRADLWPFIYKKKECSKCAENDLVIQQLKAELRKANEIIAELKCCSSPPQSPINHFPLVFYSDDTDINKDIIDEII